MKFKVATCQYQIEILPHWQAYVDKVEAIVTQAKQHHIDVLMLPEYAGIEIACDQFVTDHALYQALQPLMPQYIQLYQDLAKKYDLYIQPGTIVEEVAPNQYVNRAYFFSPDGTYGYQDKLQLTEYEKSLQVLVRGKEQRLFDTAFGKIGIAICYDSEFPEIIRALTKAGALLILVPSYTTTLAGYYRVFLSCRARAIENQCYVAVSYVINSVNISGELDNTFGQAAIVSPADNDFPDDGIIATGNMNHIEVISAELDTQKLIELRKHAQVRNFDDMHYLPKL